MRVPEEEIELCCTKDFTRPVLRHVFYDAERKKLVAADGFMLAVVPVDCDHEESCMIPPEAIIEARKKKIDLEFDGEYVGLFGGDIKWRLGKGKYPDYTQIMAFSGPKPETHEATIALSAQKLITLNRAVTVEKNQSMELWCANRDAPIIIKSGESMGLLMPMNIGWRKKEKADLDAILELLKEVVAEKGDLYPDLRQRLAQYFGFPSQEGEGE